MDNKELAGLLAVAAEAILILNNKAEISDKFRNENEVLVKRLVRAALDTLEVTV